jgi:epoxyqueuosine reductase
MGYMAKEDRAARRREPGSMLKGVRTVITLGMRHTPPSYSLEEGSGAKEHGVIAAYAHGDDYHEVMKKRLKALAADLDRMMGKHDQRVYVDTAPVLEHALAENAGLGWQGKHSLTINRQLGSWMVLGELFTTAEIEPDQATSNHCGSCSACIDICPTKAIVAPYVVDARLCISYLTIEYNGFIPRELRSLMGNRIFGCDDCQMVCPWNRHATAPEPDLLMPRGENCLPELASLLELDEASFRIRFRKSPVKRTGRAGLLRNVAIALGNSGDSRAVSLLLRMLKDESPLVRGHAVWAVAELADSADAHSILQLLMEREAVENDREVLEEIKRSIDRIKEKV